MGELICCGPLRREVFVHLSVFLYFTGESMIVNTALPFVTFSVCRHEFPNTSIHDCLNIHQFPDLVLDVEKSAALYYMIEKMMSTIPPLLMAAYFGPWSDLHGRKLPLILPYLGNMLAVVLFLTAHYLPTSSEIALVMAGFLVRSLSGHFILLHLISFSYIADLVRCSGTYNEIGMGTRDYRGGKRGMAVEVAEGGGREDQSEFLASMCRLQVSESMGVVAGATLAWAFQEAQGVALSLCMGAGVLLLGLLVVITCLQDYNYHSGMEADSGGALILCLKKMTRVCRCRQLAVDPVKMWSCVLVMFLMVGCNEGRDAITLPFVQNEPLSWPSQRFSAFIASYSLSQSVFLFIVAPLLKDRTVVVISLLASVAGGVWLSFSSVTWSMMLAGCLSHMTDCLFPALRAILSKDMPLDQMGKVLSKLSMAEGLATIIGPISIVLLYSHTVFYFPGLAFLASAVIPAGILLVGLMMELFGPVHVLPPRRRFQIPELEPGNECHKRPDFTQSLNVPSATASGYGYMWCSTEW